MFSPFRFTPAFLHNPYIYSAYRVYFTPRLALASLFRWHNETINVWTHLLPVFLFVALGCVTLFRDLPAWSTHGMHLPGAAESDRLFVPSASTADYLLLALFYLTVVHAVMVWVAKQDPQMIALYVRSVGACDFYHAHAGLHGAAPTVKPSIPPHR